MKTRKIIRRMQQLASAHGRKSKLDKPSIKALLKKLRKRDRRLRDMLAQEPASDERKALKHELNVLKKQRKKGLKLLSEADD